MALSMSDIKLHRAKHHLKRFWRELLEGDRKSFIFRSKSVLQANTSRAAQPQNGHETVRKSFVEVAVLVSDKPEADPKLEIITARVKVVCHDRDTKSRVDHDVRSSSVAQSKYEADIEALSDNKGPNRRHNTSRNQSSVGAGTTADFELELRTRQRKTTDNRSSYYLPDDVSPSKYISWVRGTTLGCILQRIYLNDGDVRELDFSSLAQRNKRLEAEGCDLVARSLSTNHTVRKVILRDHAIGDDGAEALSKMLCNNTTLEYLDVSGNGIGDRGVEALAQALYGHDSLRYLCLNNNLLTDLGAACLAQATRCNCTLISLQLSHNRITNVGSQALLDALDVNTHLESIKLDVNDVSSFVVSQLAAALARNRAESLIFESHVAEEKAVKIVRKASGLDTDDSDSEKGGKHCKEEDWDEDDGESISSGFLSCSGVTDVPLSSSDSWI